MLPSRALRMGPQSASLSLGTVPGLLGVGTQVTVSSQALLTTLSREVVIIRVLMISSDYYCCYRYLYPVDGEI